jgi:hypothetical protein
MAMKKALLGIILAGAMLGALGARAADDPSLQDVNNAVRNGNLAEAEAMMQTVLRDHPNNAKAHFVDAEVLERMGRLDQARSELARAEQLEPGLGSIRRETVENLRSELAGNSHPAAFGQAPGSGGIPWGPIVLLLGVGVVIIMIVRARRAMPVQAMPMSPGGPAYYGGGVPYGAAPPPPYGGGPGMGSGIIGGLATGAALGAGMVAGEALAHDLMGNRERAGTPGASWSNDGSTGTPVDTSDLGVDGNWDSGSGGDLGGGMGGGDDWGS